MTHKTKSLDFCVEHNTSIMIFNVIKSPSNFVILDLSWLVRYNCEIDWHKQKLIFQPSQFLTIERPKNPKDQITKIHHKKIDPSTFHSRSRSIYNSCQERNYVCNLYNFDE